MSRRRYEVGDAVEFGVPTTIASVLPCGCADTEAGTVIPCAEHDPNEPDPAELRRLALDWAAQGDPMRARRLRDQADRIERGDPPPTTEAEQIQRARQHVTMARDLAEDAYARRGRGLRKAETHDVMSHMNAALAHLKSADIAAGRRGIGAALLDE